jgi:hypothetical protein
MKSYMVRTSFGMPPGGGMRAQWGDCELLSVIYNSNTLVLVILESGVIDGRRSMMERRVPLLPSTVTK